MPKRIQIYHVVTVVLLWGAVGVGVWILMHRPQAEDASGLLRALPLDGAVKAYVDVAKLRQSGILEQIAGPRAAEDADYRQFAQQIGFDYRTDLDAVAAAFINGATYITAKGRFDWKRLADYAQSQHGNCVNGVCSMKAEDSKRIISFYQLDPQVLAWAVADQPMAAAMIRKGASDAVTVPDSVVWISAPGRAFKDPEDTLPGTRSFLVPLAKAQQASFEIGPRKDAPAGSASFEIRMDVDCGSADDAKQLTSDLSKTTDVLRGMIVGEKLVVDKGSLTSVLIAGRFEAHDAKVSGIWPVDQAVLQSLSSGQVR